MTARRNHIHFILNDREVILDDVKSSDTLLDHLRLEQRIRGTKEGCAEGDCGACTVLVGRLGLHGLVYETVNTCIRFVGSVDGCHVVTVEHLRGTDGLLHPVQQALVDEHGSQCGFCTPGFVMSLYGLWMRSAHPTEVEIEKALQGNLCRCTGYEPIIKAALAISNYGSPDKDPLLAERKEITTRLTALSSQTAEAGAKGVEMKVDDDHFFLPADVDDLAQILQDYPDATLVAGATDVGLWVTKFMRPITPAVFIGHLNPLQSIEIDEVGVTLGAGVTYSQFTETIARYFPQMDAFWSRIGGEQVRNMGTIGGNIANGSPIGDTPPALIALGATITLRQGKQQRTLPLQDYFIAYGQQDRQPGEFLESIHIPFLNADDHFAVHKISKRRDEDISSVCGSFRISLKGNTVASVVIAFGGMAATPKRAATAEAVLLGQGWNQTTIDKACAALAEDFQPISDMRASAEYRALVAGNLLKRFFLETTGDAPRLDQQQVA